MRHPIVDPRLYGNLQLHWPSRCTIQNITFTITASNQQVPSGATPATGMVNIPCRISPVTRERPTDGEDRDTKVSARIERRIVKLSSYYPQITTRTMQAVVDGRTYQIRGVEHDSQRYSTRLNVEIIEPD